MIPRESAAVGLPVAAALCALAALAAFAPAYLARQGFPLDDAWIHAVYARELARSGTLSFNPGVPATGETAPLWALTLAVLHWLTSDPGSVVMLTKVVGFALHVASAALLGVAMRQAAGSHLTGWLAAALVAGHPDLVAASVSGMEVPLATLVIGSTVLATARAKPAWLAVLGALAVGARPETAVFAAVFPLLFWIRQRPGAAAALSGAAIAGGLLSMGLLGLRNHAVSGMALPATFHAKVSAPLLVHLVGHVETGFRELLAQFPFGWDLVTLAAASLSIVLLVRGTGSSIGRTAAAMHLSGVAYCAVSFILVPPVDPPAFYHQRYVLPGVFAMAAALPLLAYEVLASLPRRASLTAYSAALVLMIGLVAQATPPRYRRLSNDARNIDDVQVAFGRALAGAAASQNAWVIDAGASRFFGRPFIVDLMGLNTPALLARQPQAFLDSHPPRYLDAFPGWSRIERADVSLPMQSFETSTPYTVTSSPVMRQHFLVSCEPAGTAGQIKVRTRLFAFRCAN